MAVLFVLHLIAATTFHPPNGEKDITGQDEVKIRRLMNSDHHVDWDALAKLGGLRQSAFPFYARILDDEKEKPRYASRTLWILQHIKADRSQFLERAVIKLADADSGVRSNAVKLLEQIGSEQDTAPLHAMLADEEFTVGVAAAEAIAAIGGPRDLVALETWLRVGSHTKYAPAYRPQYEVVRQYVTKARDELKQRLDKQKGKAPKS